MRLIFIIFALLSAGFANSADFQGKVVRIADGDTFSLLVNNEETVSVRLAEIDAPESGQPYGNRSKQALSKLIFGKNIRIEFQAMDRYERVVARPYFGDLDVSKEMVRLGAAWVYRRYVVDQSLFDAEAEARAAGRGIWGLTESQQVEPWNWRRGLEAGGKNPKGCLIKGNIGSKGDKIFHAPGMKSYGATRVDESKGERWFCSEEAALSAGWRAPRG